MWQIVLKNPSRNAVTNCRIISEARYFDKENPAVDIVADPLGFVPNQKKKSDLDVLDDFSSWPKGVPESSNHQIRVEKIGV